MQKNSLALMVALCAISSYTTAAEVKAASEAKGATETPTKLTFSGRAQIEMAKFDDVTTDDVKLDDVNLGRFGFKVTHDLGSGLTGIAGAEWKLDFSDNNTNTTTSEQPLAQRESYLGIKGDWGTFQAGNQASPYKMTGGVKYDALACTLLEARNNGGMTGGAYGHNSFISKTIAYHSPKLFGGLGVSMLYRPDTSDAGGRGSDDDSSIAVVYSKPKWEAFAATVTQSSADIDRMKVGGKVILGNHTLLAQYEQTNTTIDSTTYFLGYNLKIDKTTLVGQLGNTDPDTGAGTEYLALGAIHQLSSKFRLFGGYRSSDTTKDTSVLSIGMRMDFNS